MTDQFNITTSEQLRRTLSEAARLSQELLDTYQARADGNPHDVTTKARTDFLQDLRTDLTFREASLASAFNGAEPGDHSPRPFPMKTYSGNLTVGGTFVVVATAGTNVIDNNYLSLRKDLLPTQGRTFAWGPSNRAKGEALALALLADFAGDDYALARYQLFWQSVVRTLPPLAWRITGEQLFAWTKDHPVTH